MLLELTLLLVWTLTTTCTDDGLAWEPVPDADLAGYKIYRVVEGAEIEVGEAPPTSTSLLLGCPVQEATYCTRAFDGSGNFSVNCSNHVTVEMTQCLAWLAGLCVQECTIGRRMEVE